ncbi:hypothetical protein H0H93_014302, partial [Arthromyces matolae]
DDSYGPWNNYYYYNAGRNGNGTPNAGGEDLRNALAIEGKLDLRKPDAFSGKEPKKWKTFVTELLTTFQAKPYTYALDRWK